MKRSDIRIRKAQACDAEKLIHVHFNAVHEMQKIAASLLYLRTS